MRIAFKTFGCRANTVDTDMLYFEAKRRGFDVVSETESADAYIINSCTVTEGADKDARAQVRRYKRLNPQALIAMTGCYAQMETPLKLERAGIDLVIGSAAKDKILDLLTERRQGIVPVSAPTGFLPEQFLGSRNTRAAIKVQDGCNYSCSYCIIPKARGRSRSLPLETVLAQVQKAHELGFREVVLTGIHLAHYGWDQSTDLLELLKRIFEIPAGPRVRLSTLDPFEISDELIALIGKESKLCPYFHIALQSGSDKILSKMRRLYKAQEFVDVTQKIQSQYPDTFVGVDVIVGFPGEGTEEFSQTLKILEESFWAKLHVFPFSVRRDTSAEKMESKVPRSDIKERSLMLRKMSEKRTREFLRSQLGKTRHLLLERKARRKPGFWMGHTENYVCAHFREESQSEKGEIVPVILKEQDILFF